MELQGKEREALNYSTVLLRFAAESPKAVPEDVTLALLEARQAADADQWTPEIAARFWLAYSKLCDLIKPVTMSTIYMSQPRDARPRRWWRWWPDWNAGCTRAQIHARRYLALLLVLVTLSVAFAFISGTSTKICEDIDKLIAEGDQLAPQITVQLSNIKAELEAVSAVADALRHPLDHKEIVKETSQKVEDLRLKLQVLYRVGDQLNLKVIGISTITTFQNIGEYPKGDLSRLPMLDHGFNNVRDYYRTRREVRDAQQKVGLLNGVYNALVPLLLGAVGAATYVLRMTSDQIRDTTFSPSSPIRHVVRIALGCLAGLTVGLGGFNNELNLSSAALSFLAGYSIEPVFSALDSIAEKFRRT